MRLVSWTGWMSSGMARFKTVSESFVTTAAWTRGEARVENMKWSPRYEQWPAVTSYRD